MIAELEQPHQVTNADIEAVEAALLADAVPVECPHAHRFAPGVYLREIFMPAGSFIIGHEHLTKHFNVVLAGRALVMIDGVAHDIIGPCTFVSEPGVRKVLHVIEDMTWQTIHPTEETNLAKLETQLIRHSPSYDQHTIAMKELKQLAKEYPND
jgi:hypothetical protein